METEHNSVKLQISTRENEQELRLWVIDQLTILAEAFKEVVTAARLRIYAEDLCDIAPEQLKAAFEHARRELRFFPKIAELRELAGAGRQAQLDAEARTAWDQLLQFTRKFVSNDPHGNFGPEHGSFRNYPQLSQRILDCVRRLGGWRALACMTHEDQPFVQKRFFEEYKAAPAVEQIDQKQFLQQLAGDVQRRPRLAHTHHEEPQEQFSIREAFRQSTARSERKRTAPRLSDVEWEERRQKLQEQARELIARAAGAGA